MLIFPSPSSSSSSSSAFHTVSSSSQGTERRCEAAEEGRSVNFPPRGWGRDRGRWRKEKKDWNRSKGVRGGRWVPEGVEG